ncbi:MAG: MFS transporter [Deltaproteobacteria bacterium]|nr:MFS transporter [Deltaproteobacteria bacterium]
MVIPTIPVLSVHFHVSPGVAAQIVTAFALGRFSGTAMSGIILDHLGARASLIAGTATAAVAALSCLATPWFGLLLGLIFIIGVGDSLWLLGLEIVGIDLVRQDQRGRVISGFHGMTNGGLTLGPLLGGVLTEVVGFKTVFLGYAVCACVGLVFGIFPRTVRSWQKPSHPTTLQRAFGIKESLSSFRVLFKRIEPHLRPTYLVLVVATTTSIMFRLTTQSMLPVYAGSYLGFSPAEVGLLFSISGVFIFAMILPAGFILDKIGRKWATVPSTGLPAFVFLLIPLSDSFLELTVLASLIGMSFGLSLGCIATSTYDVVPGAVRGRLQAIRRTVAEVGGIGGPMVAGYLANTFNPGVPFLVYAPLLLSSALLLAFVGRETLIK